MARVGVWRAPRVSIRGSVHRAASHCHTHLADSNIIAHSRAISYAHSNPYAYGATHSHPDSYPHTHARPA
jgi:hypothetical protein